MGVGIQIRSEKRAEAFILHLEGRLDAVSSPILEEAIIEVVEKNPKAVLLDFLKVDYISSAGLRVLLSNSKKLKSLHGSLVVYAMSDDVMEIVKMAGFEKVLTLANNENDALSKI